MSRGLLAATVAALLCTSSSSSTALSPALEFSSSHAQLPTSRATTYTAAAIDQQLELWVNCDTGTDTAVGTSPARALRTIARPDVGSRRPHHRPVRLSMSWLCSLSEPLTFTAADGGASASAPVVYRGLNGAVISGGRSPAQWEAVAWPGVPQAAVWSAEVADFPIEIKTLRTSRGKWIQRSRWPRRVVGNYSAGWLALDATTSFNGPNTCRPIHKH